MASNFTIQFTRGDTYIISAQLLDTDTGEPMPFESGDTVYFTVRKYSDAPIDIQKIMTGFTEDGKAVIRLEPDDTKSLSYEPRKYDIEVVRANGDVHTLVKYSDFILEREVTIHE